MIVDMVEVERLHRRRFGRKKEGMDLPPALRPDGIAVQQAAEHDHDMRRAIAPAQNVGLARQVAHLGLERRQRGAIRGRQLAEAAKVLRERFSDRLH